MHEDVPIGSTACPGNLSAPWANERMLDLRARYSPRSSLSPGVHTDTAKIPPIGWDLDVRTSERTSQSAGSRWMQHRSATAEIRGSSFSTAWRSENGG